MKVSMWFRHDGLGRLMMDLLSDHKLSAAPDLGNWFYKALNLPPCDGTEDVRISMMPHYDLDLYEGGKPIIAYITDPIYPEARSLFDWWVGKENFHPIGAEDCYSSAFVVPYEGVIPFAVTGYPRYNPTINKVLIVNRKPEERLRQITTGAMGEEHGIVKMMGDLPYVVAREPDIEKFRRMYADYKVLFHYSNSPYTIVMYEAMTVGIPVVAYNHAIKSWTSVIEKFFPNRSIYPDEIRKMLREELDRTPPCQPVEYGIPSFDDIKQRWNDLLDVVTN